MISVEIPTVVLALCLCIVYADEKLVVNTVPIQVPYGRSVFINPNTKLVIKKPSNAHCRVRVLRDNPLSQRNGFLFPDVFPCDFKLGDVRYTHLGSKFHAGDFIKLQARFDTKERTRIVPFVLKIFVQFNPMEIVQKNLPIVVPEVGGVSSAINDEVLGFVYASESQFCHVSLLRFHVVQAAPRYGDLLNVTTESSSRNRFECNDFLTSDIRYHHRNLQSSNRDYVPLVVEISDKTLSVIKREYFQIIIRILGARVNERPTASFEASNTLEVKDHDLGAITSSILAAVDLETRPDEIILNISKPLGAEEGQLVSLDDPYRPLTAFYQKDIRDFKIAYRPPVIKDAKPRMFQVVFNAIDGEGAISDPILLLIMVKMTNINAPIVIRNAGLSLFEGQSRPLATRNLKIVDKDNLNDVRLQVIGGLQHGELRIMGNRITIFMATDIDFVEYHHDGSETYSDNIIFRMTDGTNRVEFVFPITIATVDDQAPVLIYNTGLVLDEGGIARIDQYMLSAIDVDSDDTKIRFKVVALPVSTRSPTPKPTQPQEQVGVLCLRRRTLESDETMDWIFQADGFYEKNTTVFTQEDLIEGRVFYRHLGGEAFQDRISFVVLDDAETSNVSPLQTFNIIINKIDDLPPSLLPGSTLVMSVDEFGWSVLNKSTIQYTDKDSDPFKLIYTISKSPYFVDRTNSTQKAGYLFLVETGVEVSKFTQMELNHGKVGYRAPDIEIGVLPRHAQFEFSVSDPAGNKLTGEGVSIILNPVNNKAPSVIVNQLQVQELNEVIIDEGILMLKDQDTPIEQIKISFSVLPRYGVLLRDFTPIKKHDWFTMDDVIALALSYEHTTPGEVSDQVGLLVDDGVHKKVAMLEMVITPKPKNLSSTVLNVTIKVRERSKEILKLPHCLEEIATSKENDSSLRVANPPRVGRILLNDVVCVEFRVQDVMKGLVSYEHIGQETGVDGDEDHFNLAFVKKSLVMEGKLYKALDVMTLIVPVDNQPPQVTIQRPMTLREGEKTQLSLQHVTITDPDTRDNDVTCTIDVQPTSGFFENILPSPGSEISNVGKRITSFTAQDIKQGNVNYVQSDHEGSEPRIDWMAFSCMDTNNTSSRYLLNIIILPKNDEAPHLYYRDFVVNEGAELVIDVTLLNAMDGDAPLDELVFYVIKAPTHGVITDTRIEGNIPVKKFTLTQIRKSTSVVYQHDGSETSEDSLTLAVSDGVHNTTQTVPIKILPVDDEHPRLEVNKGLRLEAIGESDLITPQNLKATDIDSNDENITFIVRSVPRAGFLQMLREDGTIRNLTQGDVFKQLDINRRLVIYSHIKGIPTPRDEMYFDVTDGINNLLYQVFYVFIKADDRIPPVVINKGVRLKQGARVTITTDFLSAHDIGSDNTRLRYTLTKVPAQGHLELTDAPGVSVTSFTQKDIASNKLLYVHTSDEESAGDSFDFEVTDGSSTTITRRFLISLIDVNNKKPVAFCNTLRVKEGSSVAVSPFELRGEDRDTKPESLVYTVTRVPLHGNLYKSGISVREFSQSDVNDGSITYLHDGTDTTKDGFFVSLTDGSHKEFYLSPNTKVSRSMPFEMKVDIIAVDNRPPLLVHNRGVTDLQVLKHGTLGFVLDNTILKSEDRDSNNSALIYRIDNHPLNGHLTTSLSTNTSLNNFTQHDIDSLRIRYVLYPGLNVTSDVFTFSVIDPAENTLPRQLFSIVWARVSFTVESYKVKETEESLVVTLQREGFLGDSSFMRMAMIGITADLRQDFTASTTHVQFSPGQNKVTWKLRIIDDKRYEANETLSLKLTSPRGCVIGTRNTMLVTIVDPEDLPMLEMVNPRRVVQEGVGRVNVELRRTGDSSKPLQVLCVTRYKNEQGWALGSFPTSVLSYSDFIVREDEKDSLITLQKGEVKKLCPVVIIDDTLYEEEEKFLVELISYKGSQVNSQYSTTEVIISPDRQDEPRISFEHAVYSTDESDSTVQVTVKRTGRDLSQSSSVYIRSRQTDPVSAEAGKDYVPIAKLVYFAPLVNKQTVYVNILDDTGLPTVEGVEEFKLILRTPVNGRLGKKKKTTIMINDTLSDLPVVEFKKQSLSIKEDVGLLQVELIRTGDLRFSSRVRCYTRQGSAKAGQDFSERTNTDIFLVTFNPGESTKNCKVIVTNDLVYEGEERFRLVVRATNHNARVGSKNMTTITIDDPEDEPLIQLTEDRIFVGEPAIKGQNTHVTVAVQRSGDLSQSSRVRIYTVDGTAKAGQDYQPFTKVLSFSGNVTKHKEQIKILFNKNRQMRRAFHVYIASDMTRSSSLVRKKTIVFIDKTIMTSSVTFPLMPKVVSLRHYDNVNGFVEEIPLGYPVVCVTACDPKFSRYSETGSMCSSQNIDNRLTQYRWQIARSAEHAFTDVTADTFFTNTDRVTLDSIYLTPGSRVRCVARAVTANGESGLESTSKAVTAQVKKGLCQARDSSHVGSEPFTASIAFTGARNDGKDNMVHIKIKIPHTDGLIPIISTQMPDIREMISPGALRIAQHKCSNVLDKDEIPTSYGFLHNGIKDAGVITEAEPYQFSSQLRGNTTVQFYKNLNLESCVWNFESFFDISELIQLCHGSLITGQQVKGLTQSQLSLRVPLHVSYVYRSRTSQTDWLHYDHAMFLRLTLVYDTAVLLKDGVKTPEGSMLSGSLWPTSIRIRASDKKLIVNFKTKTKFRGTFLLKKEGFAAMVISRDHPQLTFTLSLLSSQQSYDNPVQRWQFASDYAAKDYTGSYYIKLIPCVAHIDTVYSKPLVCNPKEPITFNLPIRFQQIPDPVPARFTLSVKFDLMSEKRLWLNGKVLNASERELDGAFSRDSKMYGRIMLDQGSGYQVNTEKVFLCSSEGEHTPSYDPAKKQFGCLEDSHHLVHRIKVLDRESPSSVSGKLGKAVFNAKFVSDDPEAVELAKRSDADGFTLNSAPLFEVPRPQKWFMHAVYSVSSSPRKKQRNPRDTLDSPLTYHVIDQTDVNLHTNQGSEPAQHVGSGHQSYRKGMRVRRQDSDASLGVGTGTNMKMIRLIYESMDETTSGRLAKTNDSLNKDNQGLVNPLVIGIAVVCVVLLIALVVVWTLYKRKGRREAPVETSADSVSTPQSRGTVV